MHSIYENIQSSLLHVPAVEAIQGTSAKLSNLEPNEASFLLYIHMYIYIYIREIR